MKKIISLALCVMLLICLSAPVSAAAARTFLLQEYDVASSDVLCYGKALPAGGQYEVSDGARIIENVAWSTLEQERIPVTLYCLVDCSTSQTDKAKQQREDMLLTFSSMMADEDSMVLSTIDAVMTESQPLESKDARDTAIRTISGQVWYTNLYDGISQAMNSLHASTAYNTNRCLVIISDGHDDGKSTATSESVLKQIREAGIPVYTVILNTTGCTEKDLTGQRNFAEESLGGFLSHPDKEGISASAAAQKIWNSIKGSLVIRIGLEDLRNTGADQQLLVRYDTAETRYEDTILIRAVDLPALPEEPETTQAAEETTIETTETTETTEPTEPKENSKTELVIGGGIAVLLLGAGIVVFLLLRTRKSSDAEGCANDESDIAIDTGNEFDWNPISETETADIVDYTFNSGSSVTRPIKGQCHVSAVALLHPEVAADFSLSTNIETTFGRNEKADIILNPNDKKLSGCHGCFFWDGTILLVQDRNSKNGTAVNNEFCSDHVWLKLENGAVLTAGSYEYRIHFRTDTH